MLFCNYLIFYISLAKKWKVEHAFSLKKNHTKHGICVDVIWKTCFELIYALIDCNSNVPQKDQKDNSMQILHSFQSVTTICYSLDVSFIFLFIYWKLLYNCLLGSLYELWMPAELQGIWIVVKVRFFKKTIII